MNKRIIATILLAILICFTLFSCKNNNNGLNHTPTPGVGTTHTTAPTSNHTPTVHHSPTTGNTAAPTGSTLPNGNLSPTNHNMPNNNTIAPTGGHTAMPTTGVGNTTMP